jgi:hypothetical protein
MEAFSPEEFLVYVTSFIFPDIGLNVPIRNEKFRIESLPSIKLTRVERYPLIRSINFFSLFCCVVYFIRLIVNLLQKHT